MKSRRGNCYATCKALYHLLGGKKAGWIPKTIRHEGVVHWFLYHKKGLFLDPTASQFKTWIPYEKARGRGFLTNYPSRRAWKLMQDMLWQD